MTDPRPALSVISVSYNSAGVIGEMLSSLVDLPGVETIVVDNASKDGSAGLVRSRFPGTVVVENPTNAGFAAAENLGARHARGEVILLLNPDARIGPDAVGECLSALRSRPDVGILAPHLIQPAGRLRTMEAGREPNLWRTFTHYAGLSRFANRLSLLEGVYLIDGHVHDSRAVDWVSGACMFVRRSAWDEIGGLTERWFMYAEDVDLCLRVQDAGHEVFLLMSAAGEHVIGGSSTPDVGAVARAPSSAWLLNLFDLYKLRHGSSRLRTWSWRLVASLGMRSRAVAYRIKAARAEPGATVDWSAEAVKFDHHARAIAGAPLRQSD